MNREKKFIKPEAVIITFNSEDVIATSVMTNGTFGEEEIP